MAVVALLTGLSPTAAFARPVHVTGRKSVSPIPAPTVRPAPGRTLDPSTEGH